MATSMFTIEEIKAAHSKVKSGADFPNYIQEIAKLGISGYETFVTDGHTLFNGALNYSKQSEAKYSPPLIIAEQSNSIEFQKSLREHQAGKTDYHTFCNDCAKSGVNKWVVNVAEMTCTYYDLAANAMLVEQIALP